jgi:hypothetical protein
MPVLNLNSFASILATYVREKLKEVNRAALLVRCTRDGSSIAAVFGNDCYLSESHARREVELVRRQLKDAALDEVAFGLSYDGQSWALLVKIDNGGFQTAAGKGFRTEMIRGYLEDLVWAAWRTACGADPEEAGWPTLQPQLLLK